MTAAAQAISQKRAAPEGAYKRRWIALGLLSLSLMLIVIDSTIVNIAFPAIRKTFGASFADAEWVNSIYSLVFGAALITWGKLGDQYGRRSIFVGGAIVFVLGSLGTGLASTISVMILFRAVQGMGAAMMSPSTLSILSSTFTGRERGIAFGLWGATAGVSAVIGPILGGWLITYGTGLMADSWRLAFLINVPIGVIAIFGSFWAIRETREQGTRHRVDVPGIILASLGLGLIVFAAIEGQNYGWLQATRVLNLGFIVYPQLPAGVSDIPAGTVSFMPFALAAGIILMAIFVVVELREERAGGEPLFEFGMLRYPSFRWGLMTVSIVALGEFGVILVLSIFFQLAKNLDAFSTGLRLIPFALAMLVTAPLAGVLSSRIGAKWVVTSGMVCEATSVFWLSRVMYPDMPYLAFVLPLILYGIGVGLAIAQLTNLVLSDIPPDKAGIGSGANNTIRQVGASLGIALIGAVLFGTFSSQARPLIDQSTTFDDFGKRVASNPALSHESKVFGGAIASFGPAVKKQIETAIDNSDDFDPNQSVIDLALQNMPAAAKVAFTLQGVDLSKPEVVQKIKTELAPDANILASDLLNVVGDAFSTAGRLASLVASIFVALGALSSLLLPNKQPQPDQQAVMAH